MRALAVSIWIFINLVFFGMCGYMYLLGSHFWMYMDQQTETTTMSSYDQEIFVYNRGHHPLNDTVIKQQALNKTKSRIKHGASKDNNTVTLIKNSRPRFPNIQARDFELDTKKYMCFSNDSENECDRKTVEFKDKILKELRKVVTDESNVLRSGLENPYQVKFQGKRGNYMEKTPNQVICELKRTQMKTLKKSHLNKHPIRQYLPKRDFLDGRYYNSCAIVTSAGALRNSYLGELIDSHEAVLRFNNAPTENFETDVGSKTTIRVLNSQVVSKKKFNFLDSEMYKNITLIAWDPSRFTASVEEWIQKPEFNWVPNYVEYRKRNRSKFFMVTPSSLWNLWTFLQGNAPSRLRKNPPSSGFLGLRLLLPVCNYVDLFEYVPSTRATKRCHYYDPEDNPACTFGVWHPLAAEKVIAEYINIADDKTVFQGGFVRIRGFRNIEQPC